MWLIRRRGHRLSLEVFSLWAAKRPLQGFSRARHPLLRMTSLRRLVQRVLGGANRQGLQHLSEICASRAGGGESRTRGRRARGSGSSRSRSRSPALRDERDLAEDRALAEAVSVRPFARIRRRPRRGRRTHGPAAPPRSASSRRQAELVRERRDLAQFLLAAAGEQWHLCGATRAFASFRSRTGRS